MLKRLEMKNWFKHADRTIDFTDGLTAIIGPNESGKSMIFEVISYCLFGSVALRGAAEDYKKSSAALDFEVLDKSYRITRSGSKCVLYVNGNELATGTKVVNPKIIEILGYDYKVFAIANCANQDELTKLGNMKPTERKQMVDNVIGLTIIDDLNESITKQISMLNVQVETMRANLIEPVEPVAPAGYRPAGEINSEINNMVKSEQRYHYLVSWLGVMRSQPVAPVDPGFGDVAQLIEKNTAQSIKYSRMLDLERQLKHYTLPTMTAEQLVALRKHWNDWDQLQDLRAESARLALEPRYSKEQLDVWAEQARQFQLWQQKQKLLAQGEHHCPKCQHHWPIASADLQQYENVKETAMPPYNPTLTDYAMVTRWAEEREMRTSLQGRIAAFGPLEAPTITKTAIDAQQAAIDAYDTMKQADEEFKELTAYFSQGVVDYQSMLTRQQLFQQQVAAYNQAVIEYNAWVEEYRVNKIECEDLKAYPAQVQALRDLLSLVAVYDNQFLRYSQEKQVHGQRLWNIEQQSILMNQYERVRIALKEARSTVKKYLVPSLNRVASALLAQMTGGARSNISISEDFEITVDGQPLNTLSGSGKAVSNLAIRIALGQVLIAKKFSVFMADEIDGSMDQDRAEFTADCMRRLTRNVKQLFLISHKKPAADHYIELGR